LTSSLSAPLRLAAVAVSVLATPSWAASQPGAPLKPASLFDPAILVRAPKAAPAAGTAFSIRGDGVWLTARHVVEGCPRVVIVTDPGRGVAARVHLSRGRETAILLTKGGAPPLAMATGDPLQRGEVAFHPGFPRSRPGWTASRLARRETMWVGGGWLRVEPVLAWSETSRSDGLRGPLSGLSGAPALNAAGRVIGVTIAEAPRRGRLYTTTPASLTAAFIDAGVRPGGAGPMRRLTPGAYSRLAESLRRNLSVAQVVCLPKA
jgi:S1-C subfamily serine protease